eukprot:CAMPEP_0202077576 /NCGR_PEP_ID=MMETSP0964-20121228/5451_1 /ASSEMBLY_ACC=CAM_ASM_000500 /TAXON_ID=4773 /ORGANISM="Schizochytrium aggregatum, Strain ATCC28209" /LENGTH=857 /DNA_ID=CAMNT_0048644857 /DNA_START=51 /DNA_END=2624 /DNA_ORIENTATION=+
MTDHSAPPHPAVDAATAAKEQGNAAFSSGEFGVAVGAYGSAISHALGALRSQRAQNPAPLEGLGSAPGQEATELLELLPTLFSNRSASLHKLGQFEEALRDAEQALSLKPVWAKAHHRKAQALIGLGKLEEARDAYSVALDAEPDNKFIKKQVAELDEQTGHQSAYAKIESYIERHGTIKGCPTKLSLSMFDIEAVLGEGNYSTVTRVVFKKTKEAFALKTVDKTKAERMSKRHPNIHNELQMEKRVLLRLNHPNVVKLHATFQDVSALYYLQELAPGGELWARLPFGKESLVSLRPCIARFYAAQLVNALDYLRRAGIVHRDIKPENMMLFPDPATDGRVETMKLIDFGTAYDLVETDLNGPKFVGTPEYMSPEAIAAKADPTPVLDVWAAGATMFQLHSGRIPFKGSSPYLTFLKTKALRYTMPKYFSPALRDLLRGMFKEEPSERIGASDEYVSLKEHPYFEGINFEELLSRPRRPVPSLFQLCCEAAMSTFTIGEGMNAKPSAAALGKQSAVAALPEWARTPGTFAANRVPPRVRDTLMGYFAQRLLLGRPIIYNLFFQQPSDARFKRADQSIYIGLSEQEQGKFKEAFVVVHIGSLDGATPHAVETTMRRLNTLEPAPRLVVFGGNLGEVSQLRPSMMYLNDDIPIVSCPDGRESYEAEFGSRYFSFYVGGVLFIVVDSFLLLELNQEQPPENASEHAEWLEQEILQGKLCARHVILVSHHIWALREDSRGLHQDTSKLLPFAVVSRFSEKLQDAGAQLVLCGGGPAAHSDRLKPGSDMHSKLTVCNSPPLDNSELNLRIVRVQDSAVVTDRYTVADLPQWLALEKVELGEEANDGEEESGFSDISSSDGED